MDWKRKNTCKDRRKDKEKVPTTDNSLSAYVEVLSEKNPFEEKLLEGRLRQLDHDKKTREDGLLWNQRHFFIDHAFDSENDLRFVKLIHKINTRLNKIGDHNALPKIEENRCDNGHKKRVETQKKSVVEKIFPLSDEYRLHQQKSSHQQKNLIQQRRRKRADFKAISVDGTAKVKPSKELMEGSSDDKSSSSTPARDTGGVNVSSTQTRGVKLPQIIKSNRSDSFERNKVLLPRNSFIRESSTSDLNIIKRQLVQRILDRNCKDETLMKLTKTLPFHLLLKADAGLTDLSVVLGYKERKKRLLLREKERAKIPPVSDPRFKNLFSSLDSVRRRQHFKYSF